MHIYLIVHKESGKCYVGKTVSEDLHHYLSVKRWQVKHGRVCGMPIIAAIRKYGWSAFDVFSVANAESEQELNNLEQLWIVSLDSVRTGYNVCMGGESIMAGRKMSESHKTKIGQANKGRKPAGYIRTVLHRQQLRTRMLGNKVGRWGRNGAPKC